MPSCGDRLFYTAKDYYFTFVFGSQVRYMPSFLKICSSTSSNITEECTFKVFKFGNWSKAALALASVLELMDKATSTSSLCRLASLLPR